MQKGLSMMQQSCGPVSVPDELFSFGDIISWGPQGQILHHRG